MRNRLFLPSLLLVMLTALSARAQDFSNKGKEFWIAYPAHIDGTASVMGIYITSDVAASGQITYGTTTIPFTVTPNQVTRKFLGSAGTVDGPNLPAYLNSQDGIKIGAGIRVVSDKAVVVYSHIIRSARSGATLCLPTPVLGTEYLIPSHQNVGSSPSFGGLSVVATVANTVVEITPSIPGAGGRPAGSPFTVTLANPGDAYQFQGQSNGDLSGTIVKSIASGTSGCKPIAVFSSTTWSGFDCTNASGGDNLFQQLFPLRTWGKQFITAPFINRPYDIYRVYVQDPTTIVSITENGTTTTMSGYNATGRYYQYRTANPVFIQADKPISVVQYIVSQTCKTGCATNATNPACLADPEMVVLNPIEQTLNDITFFSAHQNYVPSGQTQVTQHYVNVIINSASKASVRIDNQLPTGTFVDIPGTNYSYLQENVTGSSAANPIHRVTADTTFTAIVYGYGSVESYGYNGGTNVKDLYQFVSVQNQYATVNFPAACKSSPFYFSMTFPYQPTQVIWQFSGLFPDVTINAPTFDSTWLVNGKRLYRYKLTNPYVVNTAGTYPIRVLAQNPTGDGCSGEQEINYNLEVFERPVAAFSFTATGCISDSVRFTESANTNGRTPISWSWSFDDGGTSGLRNPSHLYNSTGPFNVRYSLITDIGCLSDTATRTVSLSPPPVANFGVSAPACVGKTLTFTDSSTTPASTIVKWIWNFGDGSPQVVAATNAAQTKSYSAAGTYPVTLRVETATGCQSLVFTRQVVVSSNPTADFTFGSGCLPQANIQFTNASTIPGGNPGQLSYSWNLGNSNSSNLQNPIGTYNGPGPLTVSLVATSAAGCKDSVAKQVNTIFTKPQAQFTTAAEACLGTTVSFTDGSTTGNGSVNQWFWDFGDNTTSTAQNPTRQYAAASRYTVKLVVTSSNGCQSDTVRQDITVLPLPAASFTAPAIACEASTLSFNSTSVANAGSITTTTWTVNGSPAGTGPTLSHSAAAAGSYTIAITVVTDKGCTSQSSQTIQVNPLPVPDFTVPTVCLPSGQAAFTNGTTIPGGGALTYQWAFGDGGASNQANPTHIYSATGPYNIQLTATSANGCVRSVTKPINTIFAQPVAQFTSPAEVCLGGAVSFTDQSTATGSSISQWQWTFGDGPTVVATQNPGHTYAAPGTYTVILNAVSAVGCAARPDTATIVVNPLPSASFTTSAIRCENGPVTFNSNSTPGAGAITNWAWNFGDGSTPVSVGTGSPQSHTYTAAGPYPVTLTVTTDKGCVSPVATQTITVNPLPVPGFTLPDNCPADPFSEFTSTSTVPGSGQSISSYQWNFGDPNATAANPNTSTAHPARHLYTVAGTYTVGMTVTTNNGCAASLQQSLTINGALPQAAFTVQGGSVFCSSDSVRIINQSTVLPGRIIRLEVFWDFANDPTNRTVVPFPAPGQVIGHLYPSFTTPASKTYTIRVYAYSGENCLSPATQSITLNPLPDIQFPAISPVCADVAPFQVNASAGTATGVFSGNGISTAGLFNPAGAGAGTHTIRFTATGTNGCVDFREQPLPVFPVPTVSAGADKFVLQGGNSTLNGTGTGNSVQYSWTPGTWLSSSTIAQPIVTPQDDMTYTLTVTSADGCTASDAVFVKVLKTPAVPNTFSPNGDGVHDRWVIEHLSTYPGVTVDIYNRYGQVVYQSVGYGTPWDGTYKGKPLPAGTYYYIINPKNGRKPMTGFVDIIR